MGMDRSMTPSTRYQALDVWRGIVCVVVVLEHAAVSLWHAPMATGLQAWIQGAVVTVLSLNLGAPLFFVISGYCIASSLDSTRRKGVPPTRFLAKRLWRIFPPYWASVGIIAITVLVLDRLGLPWLHRTDLGLELYAPGSLSRAEWLGNATLTEQWRPSVFGGEVRLINRVAWALCYQEQFYLICFLALVLAPRRLYPVLGLATLGIAGSRLWSWDTGWYADLKGFFPDLWHEFAVGLALFWRINLAKSAWVKRGIEMGLAALFAVGCWYGAVSTAAAAGFGLILIGFHRWDDAIARQAWLDRLRVCGKRSYAVYLIHLPVCTIGNAGLAAMGLVGFWPRALVMMPTVTAASVAAGYVFYSWVDRRFTKLPDFSTWTRPSPRVPSRPGVGLRRGRLAVGGDALVLGLRLIA